MQWDNRSIIFQLIFQKSPESRDDMEQKKKIPLQTINMVCSGEKEAEFFNSFLKNMACSGTKEAEFMNSFLKNMACSGTKEVESFNSF